jgi:uncharacterized protein YaiL (DUF2058 family)
MSSLRDQLLKAGVVDQKKAQQLKKEQRKEARQQPKGQPRVDENREQALRALAEKAERDREINRRQQAQAEQKAIQAQVVQLITMNRISRQGGDVPYQFADGKKIKKIHVTSKLQQQLINGQLAIARLKEGYELVPAAVAEKIRQRSDSAIALLNSRQVGGPAEDDPYADYQIPDDLMW